MPDLTSQVENQGGRSGKRASYAAHTENGKKMIRIMERWGKEKDLWHSITKFAKTTAREFYGDEGKFETIRQRIGAKRKKSKKMLDDKRSKGLLEPTTRQALSEVLALKDEKSEGGNWAALKTMIEETKPSLGKKQVENAALSVLKEGRKAGGPLKKTTCELKGTRASAARYDFFLRCCLLVFSRLLSALSCSSLECKFASEPCIAARVTG